MHWEHGPEIASEQAPERIERAVEQLRAAYRALRWSRPPLDFRSDGGTGEGPAPNESGVARSITGE